jgi:hypothetical protein
MRIALNSVATTAMLIVASTVAGGQDTRPVPASPAVEMIIQSSVQASAVHSSADEVLTVPSGEIVREIDDPHTGDRWLLMNDDSHPAGPRLLRLVSAVRVESRKRAPEPAIPLAIIHAGDRVIVEENTPVVEARLEAIALSQANAGSAFNVRLVLGGRVVQAVAVGPGRAVFQGENQQ